MELNRAVADNIKRIRKSRKLSLERTAEIAGVSRSMLGQIERGEANPSVAILGRLAAALKVPAEEFLRCDEFDPRLLWRDLDSKPRRLDGGKVVLRTTMPYDEATRLESALVDVYISGAYTPEVSLPGCVCTVTVLSGTGVLTEGDEATTLQERDTLRFAADRPWSLANRGNSSVRAHVLWQYRKREGMV